MHIKTDYKTEIQHIQLCCKYPNANCCQEDTRKCCPSEYSTCCLPHYCCGRKNWCENGTCHSASGKPDVVPPGELISPSNIVWALTDVLTLGKCKSFFKKDTDWLGLGKVIADLFSEIDDRSDNRKLQAECLYLWEKTIHSLCTVTDKTLFLHVWTRRN